jgi:hypothetical protein
MGIHADLADRFAAKVDVRGPDECWEWTGYRCPRGYGTLWVAGKNKKAHRVALEIALGRPIAPALGALHTCDNPPCCNPAHLYEGTAQDNSDDAAVRGRRGRRLRPEQKLPMRRRIDIARNQPTADDVDWAWWREMDAAQARNDVAAHVARVERGEIDARCQWLDAEMSFVPATFSPWKWSG